MTTMRRSWFNYGMETTNTPNQFIVYFTETNITRNRSTTRSGMTRRFATEDEAVAFAVAEVTRLSDQQDAREARATTYNVPLIGWSADVHDSATATNECIAVIYHGGRVG